MVFTIKNKVYDVVEETDELAISGEFILNNGNLAKLSGRAIGKNGLGDCSFIFDEWAGGQVSVSFSGCPVCAGKLYLVLRDIVASAKEKLAGEDNTGETTPSETEPEQPKAPKMFEKTGADGGQAGDNGSGEDDNTVAGKQEDQEV